MKRVKRHENIFNDLKRSPTGMIFVGVADSSSRGGGRMLWVGSAVRLHHKMGKSEPRVLPALQGLVRGCIVTESDGPNADLNTTCQLHPTSTSSRMFRVSPEEHCVFVRNSAGRCPTFPKLTRVCTNSSCSPYPEDSIFPDVSEMNRNLQKICLYART